MIYYLSMRYLFVILFICQLNVAAQNLVPNPGFELYNPCFPISGCIRISHAPNACISSCCAAALPESPVLVNGGAYNWWSVGFLTPIYLNRCIFDTRRIVLPQIQTTEDWFIPRTGNAFIVINTYGWSYVNAPDLRQFAQVKLIEPMKAGCSYELSCYALLTKNYGNFVEAIDLSRVQTAADGLGMYVSADSVSMFSGNDSNGAFAQFVPQVSNPAGHLLTDSTHYQKISGIYIAQGGEEWLVIGNFKDNVHTQIDSSGPTSGLARKSIYSIDDVSVMEWKPNLVTFTDTTICADSTLKILLPEGLKNYKWSTGETSRQINIATPGTYTVEASNGCTILRDTFRIQRVTRYTQPLDIGKDTFFCDIPETFHIDAPSGFDSFYWSTGSIVNSITIQSAGIYWLDATYSCGTLRDSIIVTEFVYPDTILIPASDTIICSNAFLDIRIFNTTDYRNFLWSNGSTEDHLLVRAAGQYSIEAMSMEGCNIKDTLKVDVEYPPVVSMQPDTTVCIGSAFTASVIVNGSYNNVEWQDGIQGLTRNMNTSGLYSVQVSNACYTVTGNIQVLFVDCTLNIPNLITVNNDGKNDFFKIETSVIRPLHLVIYNSWGGVVYDDVDYKNDWNGKELGAGIYFYSIRDSLSDELHKGWLQIIK